MTTLTPDDVRAKEFGPTRKGYSEREVDQFLDEVVAALEERDAVIARLREAGPGQTVGPAQPEGGPDSATALLALAQKTADEHVAAARAEAADIVARAERDAESKRREVLGALHVERKRMREAEAELQAGGQQAMERLESYLEEMLKRVRGRAVAERPSELTVVRG